MMTPAALLTCSPTDREAARALAGRLRAEGLRADLLDDVEEEGLLSPEERNCLLVLVSPAAERSERVRADVARALNNAATIIPVVLALPEPSSWLRLALPHEGVAALGGVTDESAAAVAEAVRLAGSGGRVIAMLNIKGGVGKTMLAANVFAAAHLLSERTVAFVDLDPQHNLTQYFLSPAERNRLRGANRTIYSVFASRGEGAAPREAFASLLTPLNRPGGRERMGFDLLAGDDRLFEFTLDMRAPPEKDAALTRFHALIGVLRARYDVVVIDTNPCATFLTRCAIGAAEHIVAPVRPERYSLTGLNMLELVARQIRERPVRPAEFSVVLNGIGDRLRLRAGGDADALVRQEIEQAPFFGSALLGAAIPYSSLLRAVPSERYAPNPINVTAIQRFSQRALKEALAQSARQILERAGLAP